MVKQHDNAPWRKVGLVILCFLKSALGATTLVNYATGFDCNLIDDGILIVRDGGRAFPKLTPIDDTCYLELSTDTAIDRGSTAFLEIELVDGYDFVSKFTYRMFGANAGSGDGMAFVLHQDSRGRDAQGGRGGLLGIYGTSIIQPALIIEFDTYQNSELGDTSGNEVHVRTTNGVTIVDVANVPTDVRTTSMDDRKEATIRFEDGQLQVLIDGNLVVDVETNLNALFDGTTAIAGFAAGTGIEADLHDVFDWTFASDASAITGSTGSTSNSCGLKWIPLFGPLLCLLKKLLGFLF